MVRRIIISFLRKSKRYLTGVMSVCSLLVLEEKGLAKLKPVTEQELRLIHWKRISDYRYAFDGPFTVREALRRLEDLLGLYLHAVDEEKNPLFEVQTIDDVARGGELLRITGKHSRHNFFHQRVFYRDNHASLTNQEVAALINGKWEEKTSEPGMREFVKEIWYKEYDLHYWEVKHMGIEDWEKLLPARNSSDLEPGIEEWERCGTCSVHHAHHFE